MSDTCYRCFKAKEACLCPYIHAFDPGVKFILLMHPQEAHAMRTGTGRIAHLALEESEIIIGIDFTENTHLNALISDPSYYPLLLFPGKEAYTATDPAFKAVLKGRKPLIILIDGTWSQAKKMLRLSTNLHTLQKLSFNAGYRSRFTFKKEPKPDFISTIESCYYLIKELACEGLASDNGAENLMEIFDRMVAFQLEAEKARRDAMGDEKQGSERVSLAAISALREKKES